MQDKNEDFNFKAHSNKVNSICFNFNSNLLASGSEDTFIKIWDLEKKVEICALQGYSDSVYSVRFSPDGSYLASGYWYCVVKIWDLATKQEIYTYEGHSSLVASVNFSLDGNFLVSGSYNEDKGSGEIKVWNFTENKEEFTLFGHSNSISSVNFSSDRNSIISTSEDNTIIIWSISEKHDRIIFEGHSKSVYSVCFSTDGKHIASGSDDTTIKIWNVNDKNEVTSLQGHTDSIGSVCFSQDNQFLVSGSADKLIKIWNLSTKKEQFSLQGHDESITSAIFSKNGKILASSSGNSFKNCPGQIKIWDIIDQKELFTLIGHTNYISSLCFSPDDLFLASGSSDKTVKIWNMNDKCESFTLKGHSAHILSVCFSANGMLLASGDKDSIIKLWNLSEKREEITLDADSSWINCITFTQNSLFLVSGSGEYSNGQIIFWNIREKRKEFKLLGHSSSVVSISISPDGQFLTSGSLDKTVVLWSISEKIPNEFENFPFRLWNYEMCEGGTIRITNKLTKISKILNSKAEELHKDYENIKSFDFYCLENQRHNSFISFCNAISNIKEGTYMKICDWNSLISNNSYTALHFACFEGKTDEIKNALLKYDTIVLKADVFQRSPLFYSIKERYQAITDSIIEYLVSKTGSRGFQENFENFFSIRNDFGLLIENSSQQLCQLLSACLYSKNAPPLRITLKKNIILSSFSTVDVNDFEVTNNFGEPLKFKISWFELPSKCGSNSSLDFMYCIKNSTDKEIFKTQIIRSYIKYKWDNLWKWTLSYTILLWINLILIARVLSVESSDKILPHILLIFVNLILLNWEIAQLIARGFDYFLDNWNKLDLIRIIATIIWIIFSLQDTESQVFNWIVAAFNIIRGVTGFRAFDMTRYYIQLIIESLKKIIPFVVIFFYTTICFGFLGVISTKDAISFHTIWARSFSLVLGDTGNLALEDFNLLYLTFFIAVILNVILMLNMIISILGDSFDDFQVLGIYYDNKEMTDVIIEIEQLFYLFRPIESKQFLHVCEHFYKGEDTAWQGIVVDIRENFKKSVASITETTQDNVLNIKQELKQDFKQFEGKIKEVQENYKTLKENIGTLDGKVNDIGQKLETIINILTSR